MKRISILSLLALGLQLTSTSAGSTRQKRRLEVNERADEPRSDLEARNSTLVPRDSYTGTGTYFYVGLGACGEFLEKPSTWT